MSGSAAEATAASAHDALEVTVRIPAVAENPSRDEIICLKQTVRRVLTIRATNCAAIAASETEGYARPNR